MTHRAGADVALGAALGATVAAVAMAQGAFTVERKLDLGDLLSVFVASAFLVWVDRRLQRHRAHQEHRLILCMRRIDDARQAAQRVREHVAGDGLAWPVDPILNELFRSLSIDLSLLRDLLERLQDDDCLAKVEAIQEKAFIPWKRRISHFERTKDPALATVGARALSGRYYSELASQLDALAVDLKRH